MGTQQSTLELSDLTSAWDPRPSSARIDDPADAELLPIQRYHRRALIALGMVAGLAMLGSGLLYFLELRPAVVDLERKSIELSVLREKLFQSTQALSLAEAKLSVLDEKLQRDVEAKQKEIDAAVTKDREAVVARLLDAQGKGQVRVRRIAGGEPVLDIEKRRRRRTIKTTVPLFPEDQSAASKR